MEGAVEAPLWLRSNGPQRLLAIDAARGGAMLLVFLAHFDDAYFVQPGEGIFRRPLELLTYLASPAFILVSGITLAFLYVTRPGRFPALRVKLFDRALFMLTVGHVLIGIALVARTPTLEEVLQRGYITDTIAVAVILGLWLVPRSGPLLRGALGVVVFGIGWWLALGWTTPDGSFARAAKLTLAGRWRETTLVHNFPVLPWLGVYLVGTALGALLGRRLEKGDLVGAQRLLFRLGGLGVLAALVVKSVWWHLRDQGLLPIGERFDVIYALSSPMGKNPPGPTYVLFYGGGALVMLALLLKVEELRWALPGIERVARFGRNALFAFIVQFYLYYTAVYLLRLPYSPAWPIAFVVTLAFMNAVVGEWERRGGQALLTVGLGALHRRRSGLGASGAAEPTLSANSPGYEPGDRAGSGARRVT